MRREKKILFVTPHFPPSPSVGTQRMVKFMKYLKQDGWEVFVLTLKEKYYPGQQIVDYGVLLDSQVQVIRTGKIDPFLWWDRLKRFFRKKRKAPTEKPEKATATVKPKAKPEKSQRGSLFFQIKEFVTRMMQYPDRENGWIIPVFFHAFRLIRKHKIPYVFSSSPPHSPYIALNALRRLISFTYVTDFRDPWARSQWSKEVRNLYEKTARYLDLRYEEKTLKIADVLIFNNDVLLQEYLSCYPNSGIREKSAVLTNGFDPQFTDLKQVLAPKATRGLDEIVIIHAGTLYKKRDPRKIFDAFIQFREQQPEVARRIRFKFLGHITPDLQYLHAYVQENQLSSQVEFLPSQPYEVALAAMKDADWLLILQPVTRIQVPAKFFDYLTIPRPIWGVVEPHSISEKLIHQLGVGVVSYNDSRKSLIEFFEFIGREPQPRFQPDASEMQKFMVPNIVRRLEEILSTVEERGD
ncbi:MAG: glycosyltransferase family 4 protein [Calditrichaeota bacterium]|nr:glycosyltransferase family 4 protein [Calditrichota bacterium]